MWPLLFLLFTRCIPEILPESVKCQLFADDILIYCSGEITIKTHDIPSDAATTLKTWLDGRGLCLNVDKTKAMFLPPATRCLIPADITIECSNIPLSTVSSYKNLGLTIDSALTWDAHIDSVVRKVSRKIGALKRAGNEMTRDTRRKYYLAVVQSDLQYGSNAFWATLSNARKNRLIRARKRDMRAVVDAPTTTSTFSIWSLLNIVPLEARMQFKLLLHTFRCVHTHALACPLLCNQYGLRTPENSTQRTTRSQSVTSLCIPHVTRRSGTISPLFTTSLLWNSLPSPLRSPTFSLHSFRQQLMKYLGFPINRP